MNKVDLNIGIGGVGFSGGNILAKLPAELNKDINSFSSINIDAFDEYPELLFGGAGFSRDSKASTILMGKDLQHTEETKKLMLNTGSHVTTMRVLLANIRQKINIQAESLLVEIEKFIDFQDKESKKIKLAQKNQNLRITFKIDNIILFLRNLSKIDIPIKINYYPEKYRIEDFNKIKHGGKYHLKFIATGSSEKPLFKPEELEQIPEHLKSKIVKNFAFGADKSHIKKFIKDIAEKNEPVKIAIAGYGASAREAVIDICTKYRGPHKLTIVVFGGREENLDRFINSYPQYSNIEIIGRQKEFEVSDLRKFFRVVSCIGIETNKIPSEISLKYRFGQADKPLFNNFAEGYLNSIDRRLHGLVSHGTKKAQRYKGI